jgi:hypothetical protein
MPNQKNDDRNTQQGNIGNNPGSQGQQGGQGNQVSSDRDSSSLGEDQGSSNRDE